MTADHPDVSGAKWHKSSHSANGGNCVEVANLPGVVAVRDSKNPDGPRLAVTGNAWSAFVAGIQRGEFGL
jgi:Domain of unknown function (DUF397)